MSALAAATFQRIETRVATGTTEHLGAIRQRPYAAAMSAAYTQAAAAAAAARPLLTTVEADPRYVARLIAVMDAGQITAESEERKWNP